MKKLLIFYLLLITLICSSCGGYQIDGLKYEKIEANHLIQDETISSYLLIKSSPNEKGKMYYNITLYCDFLRGTGRYFHYYQVDYKNQNDKYVQYYHIFDYSETYRKYAQKFAPHERTDGIKEIAVSIDYEYKLDSEEVINDNLKYHEDIITFDQTKYDYCKGLTLETNPFIVSMDKIDSENKYKFNVISTSEGNIGHFDMQVFAITKDGEIFPFYGIYHYELQRGSYSTLSYEEVINSFEISEFFFELRYFKDESGNFENYCQIIPNN